MSAPPEDTIRIHISLIDEFIARRLIEKEGGPLAYNMSIAAVGEGTIEIREIVMAYTSSETAGIDFELSGSESQGLGSVEARDYIGREVYTSSAYEFFDFMIGHYSSFDCYIRFTGNAWRVRVENAGG